MTFKLFTVVSLMLCLAIAQTANADLIINGSFEQPSVAQYVSGESCGNSIPGWTAILKGFERFNPEIYNTGLAQNGSYIIDLNTDYGIGGGIEQTIITEVGKVYTLSFYIGSVTGKGRNGTANIVLCVGDTSLTYTMTNATGIVAWQPYYYTFTATSTATKIAFKNFDAPNTTFSFLDNVSVIQGCVAP